MYHRFFGLSKDPFGMTPDPAFLFLTLPNREAVASLTYSILSRKGVILLTGDAGTGKTTLLRCVFQSIPWTRVRFSAVFNPTLTPAEFLELTLLDFGITDIPASKAQRLILLQQFLIQECEAGRVVVLLVDEAHKLPLVVLEEIRLLSNLELAAAKQLQIVLAGETELSNLLKCQDLRQLKQRVAVRLVLQRLSPTDIGQYIQHRWQTAGANRPHPFQLDAVARIAQYSQGIPRLVNALCDNALMLMYAQGQSAIGAAQIEEVARDLDLLEAPAPSALAMPKPPPNVEREGNIAKVNGHLHGIANRPDLSPLRFRLSKDVRPRRPALSCAYDKNTSSNWAFPNVEIRR